MKELEGQYGGKRAQPISPHCTNTNQSHEDGPIRRLLNREFGKEWPGV